MHDQPRIPILSLTILAALSGPALADSARASSYVELAADGFPKAVYADKSKAKLVNFYGFGL